MRQTGGAGQYGIVYINVEPAPGEGFDFVNKVRGGSIPTEFIPAVEKGVEEALENGPPRRLPHGRRARDPRPTASTTTPTPPRSRSRSPARWR